MNNIVTSHIFSHQYTQTGCLAMKDNPAHLSTDGTPATIMPLVGRLLHAAGDQTVRAQQVALQTLVREEAQLALLTVQRRPVVDHLRVDLHLVDPLHVVTQLLQVLPGSDESSECRANECGNKNIIHLQ